MEEEKRKRFEEAKKERAKRDAEQQFERAEEARTDFNKDQSDYNANEAGYKSVRSELARVIDILNHKIHDSKEKERAFEILNRLLPEIAAGDLRPYSDLLQTIHYGPQVVYNTITKLENKRDSIIESIKKQNPQLVEKIDNLTCPQETQKEIELLKRKGIGLDSKLENSIKEAAHLKDNMRIIQDSLNRNHIKDDKIAAGNYDVNIFDLYNIGAYKDQDTEGMIGNRQLSEIIKDLNDSFKETNDSRNLRHRSKFDPDWTPKVRDYMGDTTSDSGVFDQIKQEHEGYVEEIEGLLAELENFSDHDHDERYMKKEELEKRLEDMLSGSSNAGYGSDDDIIEGTYTEVKKGTGPEDGQSEDPEIKGNDTQDKKAAESDQRYKEDLEQIKKELLELRSQYNSKKESDKEDSEKELKDINQKIASLEEKQARFKEDYVTKKRLKLELNRERKRTRSLADKDTKKNLEDIMETGSQISQKHLDDIYQKIDELNQKVEKVSTDYAQSNLENKVEEKSVSEKHNSSYHELSEQMKRLKDDVDRLSSKEDKDYSAEIEELDQKIAGLKKYIDSKEQEKGSHTPIIALPNKYGGNGSKKDGNGSSSNNGGDRHDEIFKDIYSRLDDLKSNKPLTGREKVVKASMGGNDSDHDDTATATEEAPSSGYKNSEKNNLDISELIDKLQKNNVDVNALIEALKSHDKGLVDSIMSGFNNDNKDAEKLIDAVNNFMDRHSETVDYMMDKYSSSLGKAIDGIDHAVSGVEKAVNGIENTAKVLAENNEKAISSIERTADRFAENNEKLAKTYIEAIKDIVDKKDKDYSTDILDNMGRIDDKIEMQNDKLLDILEKIAENDKNTKNKEYARELRSMRNAIIEDIKKVNGKDEGYLSEIKKIHEEYSGKIEKKDRQLSGLIESNKKDSKEMIGLIKEIIASKSNDKNNNEEYIARILDSNYKNMESLIRELAKDKNKKEKDNSSDYIDLISRLAENIENMNRKIDDKQNNIDYNKLAEVVRAGHGFNGIGRDVKGGNANSSGSGNGGNSNVTINGIPVDGNYSGGNGNNRDDGRSGNYSGGNGGNRNNNGGNDSPDEEPEDRYNKKDIEDMVHKNLKDYTNKINKDLTDILDRFGNSFDERISNIEKYVQKNKGPGSNDSKETSENTSKKYDTKKKENDSQKKVDTKKETGSKKSSDSGSKKETKKENKNPVAHSSSGSIIKDYLNLEKECRNECTNIDLHMMYAYANAALDVMKKDIKDVRQADIEKLEDGALRAEFRNKMEDYISGKAAEMANSKIIDIRAKSSLMLGYFGFDQTDLDNIVEKAKGQLNPTEYMKISNSLTKNKKEHAMALPQSIINESHTKDILKYTGLQSEKEKLDKSTLLDIMGAYSQLGSIPPKQLDMLNKNGAKLSYKNAA